MYTRVCEHKSADQCWEQTLISVSTACPASQCHKDGDSRLTTETAVLHNNLLICITEAVHYKPRTVCADQTRQRWRHPRCFISPVVSHVRLAVRSITIVCVFESNHVCCCWGECVNIRKTWDAAGQLCALKGNENACYIYIYLYYDPREVLIG